MVKTRLQTFDLHHPAAETQSLLGQRPTRPSTLSIARSAYQNEGAAVFFRGIGICSARAFVVNAVQWAVCVFLLARMTLDIFADFVCLQVYEWTMKALTADQSRVAC